MESQGMEVRQARTVLWATVGRLVPTGELGKMPGMESMEFADLRVRLGMTDTMVHLGFMADLGQSEALDLKESGVSLEEKVHWDVMASLVWLAHQVQTGKMVPQDLLVLQGIRESQDTRGHSAYMVFRASKEFQARLVTADLQATTGLQGIHMTHISMDMALLSGVLLTVIHPLYLHLQV